MERRLLLLGSVAWIGGLAGAVAASRPANAAMQPVEVATTSELGATIANRCNAADAEHDRIAAQLRARLAAAPSLSSLSEKCPICGCPVTVGR